MSAILCWIFGHDYRDRLTLQWTFGKLHAFEFQCECCGHKSRAWYWSDELGID